MASFQWAAPTGKGARRVPRSMTSFGGGGRGSQQETFDAFEASDAGAEAFTMRQDEEELEVTIPVEEATAKKDVNVKFAARRLRVAVAGKGVVIDSGLKGRVVPDGCSWSFGKTKGAKALILTLEKRDGDTWAKLLAKTPPAPADAVGFLRWNQEEAYWKQNEDDDSAWRAYSEATDGPLCAYGAGVLAMRAVYTTWRRVVDAVASPGLFDEAELALARRWCYAPKRHSMDTGRGFEKTLVAAAGGPFQHGDWETPYPLPDRCDDPCVILESRLRPVCRAAMMDYVLNWIVQTMCTVAPHGLLLAPLGFLLEEAPLLRGLVDLLRLLLGRDGLGVGLREALRVGLVLRRVLVERRDGRHDEREVVLRRLRLAAAAPAARRARRRRQLPEPQLALGAGRHQNARRRVEHRGRDRAVVGPPPQERREGRV